MSSSSVAAAETWSPDLPVSTAPRAETRPAPGGGAFGPGSPNVEALDRAVTGIEAAERVVRQAEAARLRAYADLYRIAEAEAETEKPRSIGGRLLSKGPLEGTIAYRSAAAEAATTLRLTERTTKDRLEKAHHLVARYAATVEALETGEIAVQHTTVITEAGSIIGNPHADDMPEVAARRAEYESLVLAKAREVSPNHLRPYAKRIAEQFADVSLDERHEREKSRRRVFLELASDGMAYLSAYLTAEDAQAVYSRLTLMSKQIAQTEAQEFAELKRAAKAAGEEPPADQRRSQDEIRAALLMDFLSTDFTDPEVALRLGDAIEAGAGVPAVRGILQVIVSSEQLSEDYDPAADQLPLPELEGSGPISVSTARKIAGGTNSWIDVTVHTGTGDIREITSRVPSADQKRKLLVRDEHCRWPGCRASGYRCDIDHTIAVADGGPTSMSNLGFLCRNHHTLKHHGGWKVEQHPGAVYEWTSPTGRTSITRPASSVRFQIVEEPPEFEGTAPAESGPPPTPEPEPVPAPQADPGFDSWENQPF